VVNLFTDNASLGIIAVGMTLVIFTGGIDLSVGAVAGFTTIFTASLITNHGVAPPVAALAALALGAGYGALMGVFIQVFRQPPFLVTLAGMFFARGCAYCVGTQSTDIPDPLYQVLSEYELPLTAKVGIPLPGLIFMAVFIFGYLLAHHTRYGRNLLAIGGNEQSALLMGLPVGAAKIGVYTLCSALAALAGLVNTLYTTSGNPNFGIGLELDAIAVVVIGGTLLTGGRGHLFGTLFGLLILGTIRNALYFDGTLSPFWGSIVVGLLLLGFILLQRLLLRRTRAA
jgi:galactofuranose transport system permease protein